MKNRKRRFWQCCISKPATHELQAEEEEFTRTAQDMALLNRNFQDLTLRKLDTDMVDLNYGVQGPTRLELIAMSKKPQVELPDEMKNKKRRFWQCCISRPATHEDVMPQAEDETVMNYSKPQNSQVEEEDFARTAHDMALLNRNFQDLTLREDTDMVDLNYGVQGPTRRELIAMSKKPQVELPDEMIEEITTVPPMIHMKELLRTLQEITRRELQDHQQLYSFPLPEPVQRNALQAMEKWLHYVFAESSVISSSATGGVLSATGGLLCYKREDVYASFDTAWAQVAATADIDSGIARILKRAANKFASRHLIHKYFYVNPQ